MQSTKKEVEVKVKVQDFKELRDKLEFLGCIFSGPVEQDDTIFVNYEGEYTLYPKGANYLRIRRTKGKSFFTLKRGEELDSIERETEISDPKQMEEAIIFMGYHEGAKVKKTRMKTKYEKYEICLDEVEGLGSFVEVEEITDRDSGLVQQELMSLLKELGVDIKERVLNGYDTLVYRQKLGL